MMQRAVDPAAIEAEIDRVRSFGLDALRQRWRAMFGASPPRGLTKDLIARMIVYRIQEDALGGLDREAVKLLDRLARGGKTGADLNRRLKPGTVLVREYQGGRAAHRHRGARRVPVAGGDLCEPLDHRPGDHRHHLERAPLLPREGKVERHVRSLAPLAFVSPRIVAAVIEGSAPADLTVSDLAKALPHSWTEQEQRLGLLRA